MPAEPRGHARKLPSGKWQLRYLDREGRRRSGGAFGSKTEALRHWREVVEPELEGRLARRDVDVRSLVTTFLERHVASPRTIDTLRNRLARPLAMFGDVPLHELAGMGDEIAAWERSLPGRYRYSVMSAFRQALRAGVSYGYLPVSPIRWANPQPKPRGIRVFTPEEMAVLTVELGPKRAPPIRFAAATGMRPSEWATLERRDIDRERRRVTVRGTKTARSHREVPLTSEALLALDSLPRRIDTVYVFGSTRKGPFDLANFRRREWGPAIDAAGVSKPARIYDLRSTFASNALARGLTAYELARILGTSITMVELHYGALLDTAHDAILSRLELAPATG
ncbi:MAG: tyrosine-type recombinase/integrase [Gaiella sp.]